MPFNEIIAVYFEDHTKHRTMLCQQSAVFDVDQAILHSNHCVAKG
jgi:hypothetical protein